MTPFGATVTIGLGSAPEVPATWVKAQVESNRWAEWAATAVAE